MIDQTQIDKIIALEQSASPAPWHIAHLNDALCMSAVAITKNPSTSQEIGAFPEWVAEDVVAACLVQSPPIAIADDRRWEENARLITAMRNMLPELLRLAKLGLATQNESNQV